MFSSSFLYDAIYAAENKIWDSINNLNFYMFLIKTIHYSNASRFVKFLIIIIYIAGLLTKPEQKFKSRLF